MVTDIADVVSLSYGPVQAILTSGLKLVSLPFLVATEQKEHCIEVCQGGLCHHANADDDDPSFISMNEGGGMTRPKFSQELTPHTC